MRFYDLKCTSSHKDHCSNSYIPGHDIICELPSLRHIRNCRTLLLRTTKTLAACTAGRVGLDGAAGQGQARYNNDMGRGAHESMVSGRRGKEQAPNAMIGIFH